MSRLLDEILEQPDVIARLLGDGTATARAIADEIRRRDVHQVLIAARGTSDNAATYAKYLFGVLNGLPVALAGPSMYTIYGASPKLHNTLVMAISQSGVSPDIVTVIEDARGQGMPTVAITNDTDSPLAQQAEMVMPCLAGDELSVAATKTYTAELACIALIAATLAGNSNMMSELHGLPTAIWSALTARESVEHLASRYRYMPDCAVISRGYNYATAFELALKVKELSYCRATPYSSADFMHGPIAIVEPGYPVVLVAPQGKTYPELLELARELDARQSELIVISNEHEILELAESRLELPEGVPEWLSPAVAIVPGQLFAYYLTLAKRLDPDRPRGLRKVTETR